MEIEILYEDDRVVVINKPYGVITHRSGKEETVPFSVASWFVEKYPDVKDVGEPIVNPEGVEIEKPGIVHRLDRDTSGVLILAKDQEAFLHLKEQFQARTVKKEYRALVYGNIKENELEIDRPIGRSNKDFRLWSAQRGARGKMRKAKTDVEVIERSEDASMTLVALKPRSGRTHQLRVHMKAINHPIVCDPLYAPKRECPEGVGRLALHAYTLSIDIPGEGVKHFEAPIPEILRI